MQKYKKCLNWANYTMLLKQICKVNTLKPLKFNDMDKEKEIEETKKEEPQKVKFRDRVSKLYPDAPMETEDDLEAAYTRYADDKEGELGNIKDMLQIIEDLMASDEDLRAVVTDMIVNKAPFRAAIAKYLSAEDLTPLPTDEDYDAVRTAYNERVERGRAKEEQMRQIEKNEEQTYADFEKFISDNNFTEEQANQLNDTIGEVFENLLYKKITPEMLEMFRKAMDYDDAVARSDREGELRGRNSAIEAKRVAAESNKGDGIPAMVGGGSEPIKSESDKVSFLGRKRNNI